MNLITKKHFIETVSKTKEIYFIGCVHPDNYTLEHLKEIINNATREQLTYNKRQIIKINNYQMVSITDERTQSHLYFKPFAKYFKDNNIYYIVDDNSILIYYIEDN